MPRSGGCFGAVPVFVEGCLADFWGALSLIFLGELGNGWCPAAGCPLFFLELGKVRFGGVGPFLFKGNFGPPKRATVPKLLASLENQRTTDPFLRFLSKSKGDEQL